MRLKAKAKINWSLDITGVRADGYHLMDMLMQPIELHDTITLQPSDNLSLSTSGKPLLKADERHLAMRAARLLKNATGYSGGASISVFIFALHINECRRKNMGSSSQKRK